MYDSSKHCFKIREGSHDYELSVYQAGPWFTPEQEKNNSKIKEILQNYNVSMFCPKDDAKSNSGKLTLESAKEIFKEDLDGINQCYMVIADITDYGVGRDVGTAIEIGYAFKVGKPIVLLDFSEGKKSNVMLAGLASSYIRNFQEFNDWLNGEEVFHINDEELE